jgi:hypothetical protein
MYYYPPAFSQPATILYPAKAPRSCRNRRRVGLLACRRAKRDAHLRPAAIRSRPSADRKPKKSQHLSPRIVASAQSRAQNCTIRTLSLICVHPCPSAAPSSLSSPPTNARALFRAQRCTIPAPKQILSIIRVHSRPIEVSAQIRPTRHPRKVCHQKFPHLTPTPVPGFYSCQFEFIRGPLPACATKRIPQKSRHLSPKPILNRLNILHSRPSLAFISGQIEFFCDDPSRGDG